MKRIDRLKYARKVLLAQDKITLRHQKFVLTELKKTANELAVSFLEYGDTRFPNIERDHYFRIKDVLTKLTDATGKVFLAMPTQSLKAIEFETVIENQIYSMLAANALISATSVSQTTVAMANAIISQMMAQSTQENPVSPQQISKAIALKIGGVNARSRAMTIARTETHNAANMAQYERAKASARDAEIDVLVEWIATNDSRVRDNHRHADGQKQPIGAPFNVGGDKLKYPGDRNGRPVNTINCRCVLGYHLPEETTDE